MHPILWEIHGIPLYSYGALIVLAFAAAWAMASKLTHQIGLPDRAPIQITLIVLVSGLIGAHLLDVLIQWQRYQGRPLEIVNIFRAHAVIGGLMLSSLALYGWARFHRHDASLIFDITAIAASLGYGIGRIGCLLAGCCYGRPTNVPWAVVFTDPRCFVAPPLLGVPLHPTQVYAALASLLICAVLLHLWKAQSFPWQVSLVFLIGYALYRFSVEFFRADPERGPAVALQLSAAQWICTLIFALSLPIYYSCQRQIRPSGRI